MFQKRTKRTSAVRRDEATALRKAK
jgi:hypothetical protein